MHAEITIYMGGIDTTIECAMTKVTEISLGSVIEGLESTIRESGAEHGHITVSAAQATPYKAFDAVFTFGNDDVTPIEALENAFWMIANFMDDE